MEDVFGVHAPVTPEQPEFDDNSSDGDDDVDDDGGGAAHAPQLHKAYADYWASACPGVVVTVPPLNACSSFCIQRHAADLRRILPITDHDVESYESTRIPTEKVGLARVASACRVAFKRNAAISRTLRTTRRQRVANPIVCTALACRIHANIIDMLNVDLAILLAAAAIAESPSASIARALPGTHGAWRSDPRKWTRALEIAKSVYMQYAKSDRSLVYDETRLPLWLSKIHERALSMFPCTATTDAT
jgi:hypothetical protein